MPESTHDKTTEERPPLISGWRDVRIAGVPLGAIAVALGVLHATGLIEILPEPCECGDAAIEDGGGEGEGEGERR